ncbi:hypothetical protein [Micrococcus sp.]|uniref:hypothetical protein n=1 Tax=Micrococcus sp. TaxID=1271 RepID=UPI0026DC76B5|nr:hypothetical protein [Micrococcus sp.]MDO4239808.1 hypothetical protein [Micrococcus sp.]
MTASPAPRVPADREPQARFHVHWDRTSLFLVGAVALTVAVITALCALAGLPTAGVAGWSLMITVVAVVGLRVLAVRDLRRHEEEWARTLPEAAEAEEETAELPVVADPERDRRTFETLRSFETAAEAPRVEEAPAPAPASEVRPASPARSAVPLGGLVIPAVPRPTYLDAPEVERPAPAPYEAEQAPRSTARLKDPVPVVEREEHLSATAEQDIAALDLDNVLARRRAS